MRESEYCMSRELQYMGEIPSGHVPGGRSAFSISHNAQLTILYRHSNTMLATRIDCWPREYFVRLLR